MKRNGLSQSLTCNVYLRCQHALTAYRSERLNVLLTALIEKIANSNYAPETPWLCCEDYLKNIMKSCWMNPPKARPDLTALNNLLKPFRVIL